MVIPNKNFRPGHKDSGWGAFQIGGRLDSLKTDQGIFEDGYADADRYTDEVWGLTLGLNWYPNEMIRFMLNYCHYSFDDPVLVDGEGIEKENVILGRLQAVF